MAKLQVIGSAPIFTVEAIDWQGFPCRPEVAAGHRIYRDFEPVDYFETYGEAEDYISQRVPCCKL